MRILTTKTITPTTGSDAFLAFGTPSNGINTPRYVCSLVYAIFAPYLVSCLTTSYNTSTNTYAAD